MELLLELFGALLLPEVDVLVIAAPGPVPEVLFTLRSASNSSFNAAREHGNVPSTVLFTKVSSLQSTRSILTSGSSRVKAPHGTSWPFAMTSLTHLSPSDLVHAKMVSKAFASATIRIALRWLFCCCDWALDDGGDHGHVGGLGPSWRR